MSMAHPIFWWFIFIGLVAISRLWGEPSGDIALGTLIGGAGIFLYLYLYLYLYLHLFLHQPNARAGEPAEISCAAAVSASFTAGIASLFTYVQAARGGRGIALHGGQGNPNWLGLLLALSIPLTLEFALAQKKQAKRRWFWPLLFLTLFQIPALLLSHSRVAWIALGAGLLTALLLTLFAPPKNPFRRRAGFFLGGIAILFFCIAISSYLQKAPEEQPQARTAEEERGDVPIQQAWQGRLWIWRAGLDAAWESPWIGRGIGAFPRAYLEAQGLRLQKLPPREASRRYTNAVTAHSDWIESAATAGLPALLALAAALGLAFYQYAKLKHRPLAAGAVVCAALCMAGDSPLHQPAFVLPFSLLLSGAPLPSTQKSFRISNKIVLIVFALSALLCGRALQHYLCVRALTAAKAAALPSLQRGLLQKAVRLDPRDGEAALLLGELELNQGHPGAAVVLLSNSFKWLANPGTLIALGRAHAENGSGDRAARAYQQALEFNPASFHAHIGLALALSASGKWREAQSHLDSARTIFPGHPRLQEATEQVRRRRIDEESLEPQNAGPEALPPDAK